MYKKKKIYICPLGSFFYHFLSLVCRKRWLRSVSGVRRRIREQKKKVILRKRCEARFLCIMGRKNGLCLGRCMCWRNHGEKKVICKKLNLSALSGILGHIKSEFGKKR